MPRNVVNVFKQNPYRRRYRYRIARSELKNTQEDPAPKKKVVFEFPSNNNNTITACEGAMDPVTFKPKGVCFYAYKGDKRYFTYDRSSQQITYWASHEAQTEGGKELGTIRVTSYPMSTNCGLEIQDTVNKRKYFLDDMKDVYSEAWADLQSVYKQEYVCFYATKEGHGPLWNWKRRYFIYDTRAKLITYWTSKQAADRNKLSEKKGTISVGDNSFSTSDKEVIITDYNSSKVYHLRNVEDNETENKDKSINIKGLCFSGTMFVRRYFIYDIDTQQITYWTSPQAASDNNADKKKGTIDVKNKRISQLSNGRVEIMDDSQQHYCSLLDVKDETQKTLDIENIGTATKLMDGEGNVTVSWDGKTVTKTDKDGTVMKTTTNTDDSVTRVVEYNNEFTVSVKVNSPSDDEKSSTSDFGSINAQSATDLYQVDTSIDKVVWRKHKSSLSRTMMLNRDGSTTSIDLDGTVRTTSKNGKITTTVDTNGRLKTVTVNEDGSVTVKSGKNRIKVKASSTEKDNQPKTTPTKYDDGSSTMVSDDNKSVTVNTATGHSSKTTLEEDGTMVVKNNSNDSTTKHSEDGRVITVESHEDSHEDSHVFDILALANFKTTIAGMMVIHGFTEVSQFTDAHNTAFIATLANYLSVETASVSVVKEVELIEPSEHVESTAAPAAAAPTTVAAEGGVLVEYKVVNLSGEQSVSVSEKISAIVINSSAFTSLLKVSFKALKPPDGMGVDATHANEKTEWCDTTVTNSDGSRVIVTNDGNRVIHMAMDDTVTVTRKYATRYARVVTYPDGSTIETDEWVTIFCDLQGHKEDKSGETLAFSAESKDEFSPTGQKRFPQVRLSYTVSKLKEMIQEYMEIGVDQLTVMSIDENTVLQDDKTLQDYGVSHESNKLKVVADLTIPYDPGERHLATFRGTGVRIDKVHSETEKTEFDISFTFPTKTIQNILQEFRNSLNQTIQNILEEFRNYSNSGSVTVSGSVTG